mgnify:CR=1 FL=1
MGDRIEEAVSGRAKCRKCKDKIEKGSARYIQLMEEATAVYRSTLEKVAQDKSIKLIVETGGVSGVKTSELTDAIIEAL